MNIKLHPDDLQFLQLPDEERARLTREAFASTAIVPFRTALTIALDSAHGALLRAPDEALPAARARLAGLLDVYQAFRALGVGPPELPENEVEAPILMTDFRIPYPQQET